MNEVKKTTRKHAEFVHVTCSYGDNEYIMLQMLTMRSFKVMIFSSHGTIFYAVVVTNNVCAIWCDSAANFAAEPEQDDHANGGHERVSTRI